MKIGIVGYGNLGAAAERQAEKYGFEIYGVFSRRKKEELHGVASPVYPFSEIFNHRDKVDLLINAGGSKSDLCETTPRLLKAFNVVDSYDIHGELAGHIAVCERAALESGKIARVGGGWDPGFFSVLRIYAAAFLSAEPVSFWGEGVSQGHSQAIRTLRGVKHAIEYTVLQAEAVKLAELGEDAGNQYFRTKRICYVVAELDERERIEAEIRGMKDYFLGYETEIHFISESEFLKNHTRLYHKGRVLGVSRELGARLDFSLSFSSNPDFTASVLLALARALLRMKNAGFRGAYTMADIPPTLFAYDGFMQYM